MNMNILFKAIALQAREEKTPPIGLMPEPNRDIGFASVFLNLENHQENSQIIAIQNIEIQNASEQRLPFNFEFNFAPQQIELKPLENSVIAIHLTNRTGYLGGDLVKAVVTYQIGDRVTKVVSKAVEVNRN